MKRDWLESMADTADAMEYLYEQLTKDETEENEFWGKLTIAELPSVILEKLDYCKGLVEERDRLREASQSVFDVIDPVIDEVNEMLTERDFQKPSDFMNDRGRGYGATTEQWMHEYSDYVLDQSMGSIRWLKNISELRTKLADLQSVLSARRADDQ